MAVGYQITQEGINSLAGALAVRLSNLAGDTNNFATAVAGLSLTGVGFSAPDAATMTTAVGKLSTLTCLYYGTTSIGPLDNFDTDLAVLRGMGAPG